MSRAAESEYGRSQVGPRASCVARALTTVLVVLLLLAGCGNGETGSNGDGVDAATPSVTDEPGSVLPPDSGPAPSSPTANDALVPGSESVICDNEFYGFAVSLPAGWETVEGDPELRCRLIGPAPLAEGISEEPLFEGYSIWIRGRDAGEQAADLVEALRTGRFGALGPPPVIDEEMTLVAGLPATRLATEQAYVFYVVDVVGPVMLGATSEGSETLDAMIGQMVIGALGDPSPPASSAPTASCTGGWVTPEPGTDLRTEPLDALRARYGITGLFVVDDMRYFEGAQDSSIISPRYDYLRFWYVKASRQDDPSFRARWLLVAPPARAPRVAGTAPYRSTGFGAGDWVSFFGESDETYSYPGLPGEYFGIPYDLVTGIVIDTGEPEGGPSVVPAESVGCLAGT
jgi:hypothetical protein